MIYNKNNKQMKEQLIDFNKTNYGKCIFIICYTPFFMFIFITLFSFFFFLKCRCFASTVTLTIMVMISTISFCIGSYGYYKELREFVNTRKKKLF